MLDYVGRFDGSLPAISAMLYCGCLLVLLIPLFGLPPLLQGALRQRFTIQGFRLSRIMTILGVVNCLAFLLALRILMISERWHYLSDIAGLLFDIYALSVVIEIGILCLQLLLLILYQSYWRADGELLTRRERKQLLQSGIKMCGRCGASNPSDAQVCKECGHTFPKKRRGPAKWLPIIVTSVLLLAAIGVGGYRYIRQKVENSLIDDGQYVFNEELLEEIDAATSNDVPTTAEVVTELQARGFKSVTLQSGYDMEGGVLEEEELDPSSKEKHPLYTALYVTPEGRPWMIHVCNGSYMADPLFAYNPQETRILFIEDDYVTAYYANENKYVRVIPDESELLTRRIKRIDAQELDAIDEVSIEGQR